MPDWVWIALVVFVLFLLLCCVRYIRNRRPVIRVLSLENGRRVRLTLPRWWRTARWIHPSAEPSDCCLIRPPSLGISFGMLTSRNVGEEEVTLFFLRNEDSDLEYSGTLLLQPGEEVTAEVIISHEGMHFWI